MSSAVPLNPASSSPIDRSKLRMSYQARMRMPPLTVTGLTGAFGNTKRHARSPRQQLGNDGLEVVGVGAEAVQPDDGRIDIGGGFCFDGLQQGAARLQGMRTAARVPLTCFAFLCRMRCNFMHRAPP